MFKLLLATSVSVFGFASASVAQMQCDMPQQGSWLLEMGQTTTMFGPGGGSGDEIFELAVNDCGKSIVATGMSPIEFGPTKTFTRVGDQFNYSIVYGGYSATMDFEMLDSKHMTALWTFAGGAAFASGTLTFQSTSVLPLRDPRCGCQPFIDSLKEDIANNNYYIDLYRQVIKRPSNLDQKLPWEADVSEALLDLHTSLDNVSLNDAVVILNGMQGGRHRTLNVDAEIQRRQKVTPNRSGGSGEGSTSSPAHTVAKNCKIVRTQHAEGCAADIIDSSTLVHENVHRGVCRYLNKIQRDWDMFDGSPQPPSYASVSNKSDFLAAEEIRAYKASTNYIRETYAEMCGKPLK